MFCHGYILGTYAFHVYFILSVLNYWHEDNHGVAREGIQNEMVKYTACTRTGLYYNDGCMCRLILRYAPSQRDTALLRKDVSHWLCASLESVLILCITTWHRRDIGTLYWCIYHTFPAKNYTYISIPIYMEYKSTKPLWFTVRFCGHIHTLMMFA